MRLISSPRPMYQMQRLGAGKPEVPACIRFEPDAQGNLMLVARLRGVVVDIDSVWLVRGRAIDKQEYEYQMALVEHADEHEPESPTANPTRRVRLGLMKPIF